MYVSGIITQLETSGQVSKSAGVCVCVCSLRGPIKFLQLADRRSCCDPDHLTGALWG